MRNGWIFDEVSRKCPPWDKEELIGSDPALCLDPVIYQFACQYFIIPQGGGGLCSQSAFYSERLIRIKQLIKAIGLV